jgi:hypothetical protein
MAMTQGRSFQVCWFVQLPGDSRLTLTMFDWSKDYAVDIFRMNGSDAEKLSYIPNNDLIGASTFAVVAHEHAGFSLDVVSQSDIVDWQDREGLFADCRKSMDCQQNTSNVEKEYLPLLKREMPNNLVIAAIIIGTVGLGAMAVLLFWDAGSEFSMGSGMRPLGKVHPLPFT